MGEITGPPRHKEHSRTLSVFGFLVSKSSPRATSVFCGHREESLEPWELITCQREIEQACGMSRGAVIRNLKSLAASGMIEVTPSNRRSKIRIVHITGPREC